MNGTYENQHSNLTFSIQLHSERRRDIATPQTFYRSIVYIVSASRIYFCLHKIYLMVHKVIRFPFYV